MRKIERLKEQYFSNDIKLSYYEIRRNLPVLMMLHAQGTNALSYDPFFGEAFYSDTFHAGIPHEDILKKISCNTLLMKAKTAYDKDGHILLAAMSEEDAQLVKKMVDKCKIMRFECGHGVHIEKEREFIRAILNFTK